MRRLARLHNKHYLNLAYSVVEYTYTYLVRKINSVKYYLKQYISKQSLYQFPFWLR